MHSQIWIFHRDDHHVDQIPQTAERVNDLDPNWVGDTIYFRSDRKGQTICLPMTRRHRPSSS